MKIGIAASAALMAVLAGSAAYASIPDAGGVIHGCYRPTGPAQGNLVIIDSDVESCPPGYASLDWNQAGVSGHEVVTDATVGGFMHTTYCPAGKTAISGGVKWNGVGSYPLTDFSVNGSYPTSDSTGWTVVYRLNSSTVDAYAVCVYA